jgi:hypothetical protein
MKLEKTSSAVYGIPGRVHSRPDTNKALLRISMATSRNSASTFNTGLPYRVSAKYVLTVYGTYFEEKN